ncbi:MAG: hypothetical protein WCF67_02595 [Chitinophagaceae bacterium]
MKNISLAANVVLIGVIALLVWGTPLYIGMKKDFPRIANPTNCVECKDYSSTPIHLLDAQTAQRMAIAYASDNGKNFMSTNPEMEDARSLWFDLETIKNFIWRIEKGACNNGCGHLRLGIRIYYAKYPNKSAMSIDKNLMSLNPDFAERHTLFMVPTYFDDLQNQH